jgi:threonyl-tRNA synthetase
MVKAVWENKTVELPDQVTLAAAVRSLGKKITGVVAGKINGALVDLNTPVPDGASVELVTETTREGLELIRHSASHIMAEAVTRLYPGVKLAIGPSIEDGFYYDFDVAQPFTPEDLTRIEQEMGRIIAEKKDFQRMTLPRHEAIKLMGEQNQPYKVELLNEIKDDSVTLYQQGKFIDLCRGPHLPNTSYLNTYKLLSATGAYWRGNEKNKMLQRIYGTAFPTPKELEAYLKYLEDVKKRDHRRLGKDLDLFSIHPEAGPGLIYWHPKGALVRKTIEDFWREAHLTQGYQLIYSPHIAKLDLWKTSGHWEFYRDNMYAPMQIDQQEYLLKPMNCPGHILVYKTKVRSYRDLPLRWAELGTVYRYERAGVIQGLFRVRGFTQDDAHIFCTPEQLNDEITGVIKFGIHIFQSFGFKDFQIRVSTRPEKYVGTEENWERATESLTQAVIATGLPYHIAAGEAVFYGPKADIDIKDSLGRAWQCFTVQVDFNLPERFDIVYTRADGTQQRPIMIHRALMGSLERFFGILIEHYGGAFPLWLAPVQTIVLPVLEAQHNYARKVGIQLRDNRIRAEIDLRNERLSQRIREAIAQRIPYMAIVGAEEETSGNIAVRELRGGDLGRMELAPFIHKITKQINTKE